MKSFTIDLGGPVHVADHGGDGPRDGARPRPGRLAPELGLGRALAVRALPGARDRPRRLRPQPRLRAGPSRWRRTARCSTGFSASTCRLRRFSSATRWAGCSRCSRLRAAPDLVSRLVLVNPAFPRRLLGIDRRVLALFGISAIPYVAEYLFRRRGETVTPEVVVEEFMALCCRDPETISRETIAMHLEFARRKHERPWADDSFLQATRSLLRVMLRRTSIDRAVKAVRAPTLLISGAHDRLRPGRGDRADREAASRLEPRVARPHRPRADARGLRGLREARHRVGRPARRSAPPRSAPSDAPGPGHLQGRRSRVRLDVHRFPHPRRAGGARLRSARRM